MVDVITYDITKLKVKLLESDLPQYQIAARMGMHPSTLSAYSLGKINLRGADLRRICRYFKCKQTDILGTVTFTIDGQEVS